MKSNNSLQNRISGKFEELYAENKKALITFITAGDPDIETTIKLVLTLEKAGADIIELGVPYSDPLADGPVIQEASQRALQSGTSLKKILEAVSALRQQTKIPIILMTYYNPLLKYGLQKLATDAFESGVDGFIVPDLPMEESDELKNKLSSMNISLIPLVAPTSGIDRIKQIAAGGSGFVYCVSLTGVTGVRVGLPDNLKEFADSVKSVSKIPVAVGFGISTPQQVAAVSQYCDAVIVGSALVKTIGENAGMPEFYDVIYSLVKSLKEPL
ncbi:tryptophan synthase subunit alpha [Phosphitispora sp. TUW77]|uniref:tryptophan synthase subunit alpha n=1 Tax=Phosphitispora sp. TUW77 TaxID=3152361 RepID=UPI003AB359FE